MSEIDVSKCEFKYKDSCCLYDEEKCKYIKDCYYKQLQQLKQENEGLESLNDFNVQKIETLEAENEELKKLKDEILNKIKEVKSNG